MTRICDICGIDIPEDGIVMLIQDVSADDPLETEEIFDMCITCYDNLKIYIKKEQGS